jgi:hypothetical protein
VIVTRYRRAPLGERERLVAQQTETLARPLRVGARSGWRRTLAPHEGLIIGAIAVFAFMAFWEWVGTSGVINPMFSSSPSRIM